MGLEVTCSDGVFCNGPERLILGRCEAPGAGASPRPCFAGAGSCREYPCDEAARSCGLLPVYDADGPASRRVLDSPAEVAALCGAACDRATCNPPCAASWECGYDGCLNPCFKPAVGGPLGDCAGVMRRCNSSTNLKCPTQCLNHRCRVVPASATTTPAPEVVGSCAQPVHLLDLEPLAPLAAPPRAGDAVTLPSLPFNARFAIDLTGARDHVLPECGTEGTGDVLVKFRIPSDLQLPSSTVGFEVRLYGADGAELDQVLEIRPASPDCKALLPYPTGTCSDDSMPPGAFGSRVFGQLDVGAEYLLVASVYSNENRGLSVLEVYVSAVPCTPQCEGKTCGNDGCPGDHSCGSCGNGNCCYNCASSEQCRFGDSYCTQGTANASSGICLPGQTTCKPDCRGRSCGPSKNRCPDPLYNASNPQDPRHPDSIFQCGRNQGKCPSCDTAVPQSCDLLAGKCRETPFCDGLNPACPIVDLETMETHYCGTDCTWHPLDEDIVDLVIGNEGLTVPSFTFTFQDISPSSPALLEGCIHVRCWLVCVWVG